MTTKKVVNFNSKTFLTIAQVIKIMANIENIIGNLDYEETKQIFASALVNLQLSDVIEILKSELEKTDIEEIQASLDV